MISMTKQAIHAMSNTGDAAIAVNSRAKPACPSELELTSIKRENAQAVYAMAVQSKTTCDARVLVKNAMRALIAKGLRISRNE